MKIDSRLIEINIEIIRTVVKGNSVFEVENEIEKILIKEQEKRTATNSGIIVIINKQITDNKFESEVVGTVEYYIAHRKPETVDNILTPKILVKYKDDEMQELEFIAGKSDWIDLRANEDYELKEGDFKLIDLGVAMQLPKDYEAHIAPRSSTFKNYGIIQVNSMGIIDNSYCGDDDYWMLPVMATKDTKITKGDRICQFRIMKKMPAINLEKVEKLNNKNRDGFGSTGVK